MRLNANPLFAIHKWLEDVYHVYKWCNLSNFSHFRFAVMDTYWCIFILDFEEG